MNLKIETGQILDVQAYKHDGTLYRQWNGLKVLEVSDQSIVLLMFKTKVIEKSGQKWIVREPTLWWFPRDEWHNTSGLIRASGTYFYTNIASPFIFEDNTIKYIDYDLDIKAYPEKPVKVVDRKEFERHSEEMKYPQEIIDASENELKSVLKLINAGDTYFDEEVVDQWIEYLVEKKYLGRKFIKKTDDYQ